MASLTDRLDSVLGAKAARALEDVFGIRTVDDLLRHYPRKYSQGSTVRGEDDDPRNDLVFAFGRFVCDIRPRMFIMENVPGLLGQRGHGFRQFLKTLDDGRIAISALED